MTATETAWAGWKAMENNDSFWSGVAEKFYDNYNRSMMTSKGAKK